ncbi:glycerophosphodiester phosphodiesterase family protein [Faecalibacterium hattorii]|uniref:glycerophosphodiester phosphodiesterase family protein n=1 Tax=Faecalibacterium hattorii TaxID=2935520 RepID=UPI003AAC6765
MTQDGVAVVTHDTNLRRCTGKNAKVYDLTFAEIEQLDAGSWFSTRFAGTRIPSLEEVLQLCQGKIDLNVEIKPSAATPTLEAETVRLLREYGFEGHCVITSQSYETLHKVKELAPDIPTGYILALGVGNYYDLPDADFFSVETTFITSGMVNQIHLRGKTVSAWTIDREEDAKHMMELGADDLITDKPDMVNELLSQNAEMDTTLLSLRDAIQNWFFPSDEEVSDSVEEVIEDVIEDPEEFLDAA